MEHPEVTTKGQFAAICNVSAARVSQWLSEGMISGDAIVGEGRAAKINVAIAQRQLRSRRDFTQSIANGAATNVRTAARLANVETDALALTGDQLDDALRQAKLWDLEAKNRRTADEEKLREGFYTETASARREMAQVADDMLRVFEGFLTDAATAVNAAFGVEHREVLHLLRKEFRKVRVKAAGEEAALAAECAEREDP